MIRISVWSINQQFLTEFLTVARHSAAGGWDGVRMSADLMPVSELSDVPAVECWTTLTSCSPLATGRNQSASSNAPR